MYILLNIITYELILQFKYITLLKIQYFKSLKSVFLNIYNCVQKPAFINSSHIWLAIPVCLAWEMESFKYHPSICGCWKSLTNEPQLKQPEQLSALILAWIVTVYMYIQLFFDGEKWDLPCAEISFSQIQSHKGYIQTWGAGGAGELF